MIFFEFSDLVVSKGIAPAPLCCAHKWCYTSLIAAAERIYSIEGNIVKEIKNRYAATGTMHISDEDLIILKLKAVPI